MGVSFEEEYESRNIKSMNSLSDRRREAAKEAKKKFKTFANNENPIEFLKNYGKPKKIEETDEEDTKEIKRKIKRESEMRLKKSDSDSRPKITSSRHRRSRDIEEEEDKEEIEDKITERQKREKERSRENNLRSKAESELRAKSADCFKRNNTMSSDEVNKYKLKHTGGGENALDELLKMGSEEILQQQERKRESSGWNISDDDLEEYMKMKPVSRKSESDEGFSFKSTGLYLGAASLLAAGVTVAFVKAKFFS